MPIRGDTDELFIEAVQRLRAAAQNDRTFDAAQMQLINLTEIIAKAGPHWPLIKDKIRIGSMSFLKGCLDERDIVIPAGDGFLIIFADERGEATKARAEELREMLLAFYLGEDGLKELGIAVSVRRLSSAELTALVEPPAPISEDAGAHEFVFAPIWSAQAQVVASYMCMPMRNDEDGLRYGYDRAFASYGRCEHRGYCQLDLDMLDRVEAALKRAKPGETRAALGVSVHSTTLQHRTGRGAYLERLGQVAGEHPQNLFVKIAEIESGTPAINLADWTGMLRAHVRHILFEFRHTDAPPTGLGEFGVWGAGFAAPAAVNRVGADSDMFGQQVRWWGEALRRQRARFFVDHVRRSDLVQEAAAAGASFITGDSFWPFETWPGGVMRAPAPAGPRPSR